MKLSHRTPARRGGFTLIELLVVIAIILILVGLLAAGVSRAIIKGQEARNRNDIMQLEMALQSFKTQYGFYPPSLLALPEIGTGFPSGLLGNDSQYYLSTMFPRIDWTVPQDWDGNGQLSTTTTLTGDQCLVFFLGGMGGVNGFATNPKVPGASPSVNPQRTATFYEFQLNRLSFANENRLDASGNPVPNVFPVYLDVYGKRPYLYFSSYKQTNGYIRYGDPPPDCPQNGGPYRQAHNSSLPVQAPENRQFWKPNSFQIISAGRDKKFGNGPNSGGNGVQYFQVYVAGDISANAAGIPPDGQDDQANFAPGLLGGGQ